MTTKKMVTRSLGALLLTGSLVGAGAGVASANQGQRPETFTSHEFFEDETIPDVLVCDGETADITLSDSAGVFHVTSFADGRFHVTGTFRHNFSWVQNGVTYTGHVTGWFGENANSKNFTETFTLAGQGKGSDGSKVSVKALAHMTVNANGDVVAQFRDFSISCR